MRLLDLLRCWAGHPRVVMIDPTGGDPALGGPVTIPVCAHCQAQIGVATHHQGGNRYE